MFSKAFFFLILVLASCTPPDESSQELSSEALNNREPSREYFQYQLTSCTGQKAECMNNTTVNSFIDIAVKDGKVEISRPLMDSSINAKLKGKWDSSNSQITGISGKFGIAHTEDWSLAEGFLYISEETVTGSIDGISIEYNEGANPKCGSGINISCTVSLSIGKDEN